MSKTDTLVILSPGFPANEGDSTAVPAQQVFVRNLKRNFPQLNIIVLAFQYPYSASEYQWSGVTVISFGGRNKGNILRIFNWIRVWRKLRQLKRQYHNIGLLSFWMGECALIGSRFAKMNKLKHCSWILGQDARKENKYPKRIRPNANELIALSDFIQNEFEKNHGIRPQHVILPGIDPKQFAASTNERDIDLLAAGSLIPLKQCDIFIEIVAEIKKQLPGIKAMLIGDGPEKERLKYLITKYQLQPTITLTGELPHPEVLQLMQRTKVFLHPSAYEGFGVVCLEALYGGASVISFVKPMKKDIKNWLVVGTKEEMKQKLLDILQASNGDPSSVLPFLMSKCVEDIVSLFGWGK